MFLFYSEDGEKDSSPEKLEINGHISRDSPSQDSGIEQLRLEGTELQQHLADLVADVTLDDDAIVDSVLDDSKDVTSSSLLSISNHASPKLQSSPAFSRRERMLSETSVSSIGSASGLLIDGPIVPDMYLEVSPNKGDPATSMYVYEMFSSYYLLILYCK